MRRHSNITPGLMLLTAALALFALSAATSDPALGRVLNLEMMPIGYVMSADEVLDTLGRNVVVPGIANEAAGEVRLPDIPATVQRRDTPSFLLLSNSPEVLDDLTLPHRRGILVAADIPAGSCRILVSHTNINPLALDLVLRMTNASDEMADVLLQPRVIAQQNVIPGKYQVDSGVGGVLARMYFDARDHIKPGWQPVDGEVRRIIRHGDWSETRLISNMRGLGMAWLTLTTTAPLHLTVYGVPGGMRVEGTEPVIRRAGSQTRGLFEHPDLDVTAQIDVADGVSKKFVFGAAERNNVLGVLAHGNWMTGTDTTDPRRKDGVTNRGDFGGITLFRGTITAAKDSPYKSALLLLVAGGRKAAVITVANAKMVILNQWEGLILGRVQVGESFQYEFTLPPNSWAPVYLVAVPLHRS